LREWLFLLLLILFRLAPDLSRKGKTAYTGAPYSIKSAFGRHNGRPMIAADVPQQ
jgi:hypothetical protein